MIAGHLNTIPLVNNMDSDQADLNPQCLSEDCGPAQQAKF